jgi:hypothetical protein
MEHFKISLTVFFIIMVPSTPEDTGRRTLARRGHHQSSIVNRRSRSVPAKRYEADDRIPANRPGRTDIDAFQDFGRLKPAAY